LVNLLLQIPALLLDPIEDVIRHDSSAYECLVGVGVVQDNAHAFAPANAVLRVGVYMDRQPARAR
jgi:hypothetical protein